MPSLPIPSLPIDEWIKQLGLLYDQFGYSIVLLSALIENTAIIGLILPGNSLVLLGAFYARLGTLNLGLVILWASLGTIIGYHIDYLMGRFLFSHLAERWGKTALGKRFRLLARLRLARMFISRHGGKAILLSHFVGHIRSFVAISAGMMYMRYRTFLLYEIIAATAWTTMYACVGYFIAVEIDQLSSIFQRIGIGLAAIVVVGYLIWRFTKGKVKGEVKKAHKMVQKREKDTILQ